MADDSNLDYVRTFLGYCHTTATVKHVGEKGTIRNVSDASGEKMFVYPPTLLSSDINHYTERYQISLSEANEAGLLAMRNDIITNIEKLNRRQVITGYTRETTLLNATLRYSNKIFINPHNKRADQDLFIDFEWSTS